MSDLRDAFKKAGLIPEDADKRFQHEERVRRKELGRKGLEQEKDQQRAAAAQRDQERRADVKDAQQRLESDRERKERSRKLLQTLRDSSVQGAAGSRRFHYREADGHLPFVSLNDDCIARLEAGQYGLAEAPGTPPRVVVIPAELAAQVAELRPDLLRHWNGRG